MQNQKLFCMQHSLILSSPVSGPQPPTRIEKFLKPIHLCSNHDTQMLLMFEEFTELPALTVCSCLSVCVCVLKFFCKWSHTWKKKNNVRKFCALIPQSRYLWLFRELTVLLAPKCSKTGCLIFESCYKPVSMMILILSRLRFNSLFSLSRTWNGWPLLTTSWGAASGTGQVISYSLVWCSWAFLGTR